MSDLKEIKPDYSGFTDENVAFMDTITGIPARKMIQQSGILQLPTGRHQTVLDNACGGGVVASCLIEALESNGESGGIRASDIFIICADSEKEMVKKVAARIANNGWKGEAKIVDATKMDLPDAAFTQVFTNFGVQLFPDRLAFYEESHRVLVPGGVMGFTSWRSVGWLAIIQSALPDFQVPGLFFGPSTNSDNITEDLTQSGFKDIVIAEMDYSITSGSVTMFMEMMEFGLGGLLKVPGNREKVERAAQAAAGNNGEIEMKGWKPIVVTATKA